MPYRSLILQTSVRYMLPLLLLFALVVWWRGHNEPGGGFVGGLAVAAAFSLQALAHGAPAARQSLRIPPIYLMTGGLLLAVASGLISVLGGVPFLTGVWGPTLPLLGKIGTPTLFDLGVMLTVAGVVLTIVFSLAE